MFTVPRNYSINLLCLSQQLICWWCQEGPVFSAGRKRSCDLAAWGCCAKGPRPPLDSLSCSAFVCTQLRIHVCVHSKYSLEFHYVLIPSVIETKMNKTVPAFKGLRVQQRRWDPCPKKNKTGQNVMSARDPGRESTHFQLGSRSLRRQGLEGRRHHRGSGMRKLQSWSRHVREAGGGRGDTWQSVVTGALGKGVEDKGGENLGLGGRVPG